MNMTVKSLKRQRGLTLYGWTFAILVFGFGIICAYKIAPPYFDNWQIQSALETLDQLKLTESAFDGVSDEEIKRHLGKYFTINNVPSEFLKKIKITRTKGRVYVDLNWETRTQFLYNIDVVITFANQFDSLNPSACCTPQFDTTKTSE